MVLLASALLATTAAATAAAAAPRPGQTPQHEQLNPNVAYRVANSVQPGAQFFMGGDGQSYFDVLTPPIRTRCKLSRANQSRRPLGTQSVAVSSKAR
jgi:hypothetical protein